MRLPLIAALLASLALPADEGMWTFDNLPLKKMKDTYGFAPDQAWLDHVRLSALGFAGGSGSFVSAEGLAITNHHVGRGWVQSISGPGAKDYIKHGFVARTRAEEIKIPGATLRTLMRMDNVTDQVNAAVKPGMSDAEASKVRSQAIRALLAEREKATGLSCSPVNLYQGGETWIYGYKVHKDIRLVMAPEVQIAAFGGDPDNFTYPRHDLDFTLFRVYENDRPYKPEAFLTWAQEGLKTGDLTFVVGHPGRTQRLNTHAQMISARDVELPARIASLEATRRSYKAYAAQSPEHARQVKTTIYGVENSLKASRGYLAGLKVPEALQEIKRKEDELRAKVDADPRLRSEAGESWIRIERALNELKPLAQEARFMTTRGSSALQSALNLVRIVEAAALPEAERPEGLRTEAEITRAKEVLDRPARNSNPELERFQVRRSLREVQEGLPAEHPFRQALLSGQDAETAAKALEGSKVPEAAFRASILSGGKAALDTCQDPAVRIARAINPLLRDLSRRQSALQTVIAEQGRRIAQARFAVYGKSLYPDATGSLRLTYGPVSTYPANGTLIQPFTSFHGLFDRAQAWGPEAENGAWALPERWIQGKSKLNLDTPFNFCHSVDIIGGNSGSPVLNRKGEFVGVIFDGNIEMLPGNFYYDGAVNRGVTLDARAILESLGKLYDAKHLVKELTGK